VSRRLDIDYRRGTPQETLEKEAEIVRLIKAGHGRAEICAMLGYKKRSGLDQRIALLRAQGDLDGVKINP
jgi:hypothetical protein